MTIAPRVVLGLLVALLIHAVPARSQTAPPERRWAVEVHVGGAFGNNPTGGSGTLPPPGETFTPLAGGPPSRVVPSWMFGDGTALHNQVASNLGLATRITPLDTMLTSRMIRQQSGVSFGGRLTRWLSPRFDFEVSGDFNLRRSTFVETVTPAIDATRASYISGFNGLFASAPAIFANPVTTLTASVHDHSGLEGMGTAAVIVKFGTAAWQPFASFGGGFIVGLGDLPSLIVTGDYQFTTNNLGIHQIDTVTVTERTGARFVGLVGGGVTRNLSPRTGVRVDARLYFAGTAAETELEAGGSSIQTGQISVVYPFPSALALSFSSNPQIRSSLTGSVSTTTFTGQGTRVIGAVTVGMFVRL